MFWLQKDFCQDISGIKWHGAEKKKTVIAMIGHSCVEEAAVYAIMDRPPTKL